jgi:signal transduction histidine kinase
MDELRKEGVKDLRQHIKENPQVAWDMAAMVKVLHVNEATLKLFGAKSHDEILGQVDRTFGPDSINVLIEEVCAIWDKKKFFRAEASYRSLGGKAIDAIISFMIPDTPEGFKSLPVSIIDITELKKVEAELVNYRNRLEILVDEKTFELKKAQSELLQRERLVTMGELTATVSHELRNPLGTIQSALFSIQNFMQMDDPDLVGRAVKLAERNIARCVTIIEELNYYARVKELNIAEESVDDWLKDTLTDIRIPEDVRCETNLACDVLATFDQEKLRQVINNLVLNSLHALQGEGLDKKILQISTRTLDSEYEIAIRDTGTGIPRAIIKNIFEPLFSTKDFGVGLGIR